MLSLTKLAEQTMTEHCLCFKGTCKICMNVHATGDVVSTADMVVIIESIQSKNEECVCLCVQNDSLSMAVLVVSSDEGCRKLALKS